MDEMTKLENRVAKRNEKLADVIDKIHRQDEHIKAVNQNRERLMEHVKRWVEANKRDVERIREIRASEAPQEAKDGYLDSTEKKIDDPNEKGVNNG